MEVSFWYVSLGHLSDKPVWVWLVRQLKKFFLHLTEICVHSENKFLAFKKKKENEKWHICRMNRATAPFKKKSMFRSPWSRLEIFGEGRIRKFLPYPQKNLSFYSVWWSTQNIFHGFKQEIALILKFSTWRQVFFRIRPMYELATNGLAPFLG